MIAAGSGETASYRPAWPVAGIWGRLAAEDEHLAGGVQHDRASRLLGLLRMISTPMSGIESVSRRDVGGHVVVEPSRTPRIDKGAASVARGKGACSDLRIVPGLTATPDRMRDAIT
jgi:hypothetical protein